MHPKVAYTGIDLAQQMVELAKKRLPEFNFAVGNAEKLTFKDGEFDAYLSSLCLQIVENPAKMMQEAYRVLKPGGVAAFSIWGPEEMSSFWNSLDAAYIAMKEELTSKSNFHL